MRTKPMLINTVLNKSVLNKPVLNKPVLIKVKFATMAVLALTTPALLTGCGFHLRGYETPMNYAVGSTVLSMSDDATSFPLKRPLHRKLNAAGVQVVDDIGRQINLTNEEYTATIRIDNVRFKKYELVGVLTEIRVVLAADVTYQTLQNSDGKIGTPIKVTNPIQVEQSYQFNEASVSIEDQQGEQIRQWLYDSLAQRITDQYVALSLPRVSPETLDKDRLDKSSLDKNSLNKNRLDSDGLNTKPQATDTQPKKTPQ